MQVTAVFLNRDGTIPSRTIWRQAESGFGQGLGRCTKTFSTIERRVRFMIVKVGDSLGETFGNFVGRLAATQAVLTPVIPAFRAGVLVVHPVLPDRDHATMLTMVKEGSWFGLAHRHPSSMGFYRAGAGADNLKQDGLRAAAGQRSIDGKGQG